MDFVTVGLYDASLPADKQLKLQNKSLIWTQNSPQVPSDHFNCLQEVTCFIHSSKLVIDACHDKDLVKVNAHKMYFHIIFFHAGASVSLQWEMSQRNSQGSAERKACLLL